LTKFHKDLEVSNTLISHAGLMRTSSLMLGGGTHLTQRESVSLLKSPVAVAGCPSASGRVACWGWLAAGGPPCRCLGLSRLWSAGAPRLGELRQPSRSPMLLRSAFASA